VNDRCRALQTLLPEFAMGVLAGEERAIVVAYLDTCPVCRAEAAEFTSATDAVLDAVPAAEPPVGFETRVVASVAVLADQRGDYANTAPRRGRFGRTAPGARSSGWRRRVFVGAIAAASAAIAATTAVVVDATQHPASALSTGELLTPEGRPMGAVFVHGGPNAFVFLSMWGLDDQGQYRCLALLDDGTSVPLWEFTAKGTTHDWGGRLQIDPAHIVQAQLVEASGQVIASGVLHR